jgi:hypothetical protein
LLWGPCVRFAGRESHRCVVMNGIHAVGKHFIKGGEIHGVSISVQKQNMVWVHGMNSFLNASVEALKSILVRISWFVYRVVPSHLWMVSALSPCGNGERNLRIHVILMIVIAHFLRKKIERSEGSIEKRGSPMYSRHSASQYQPTGQLFGPGDP